MKFTRHVTTASALAIALALLIACSKNQTPAHDHSAHGHSPSAHASPSQDSSGKHQCSMHPNIVSDSAGTCPICGMDLQPVQALDLPSIPGRASVALNPEQERLINLRVAETESKPVSATIETQGVLQHDPSNVYTISAWTSGRIEQLIVNQEETVVEKGDPLFRIYSPDLYSALQDYFNLDKSSALHAELLDSARFRLMQLGLQADQIASLDSLPEAPRSIEIHSPASGTVMMKNVNEGQYVKEGDALYTVVDLSELWLIADIYESDLPFATPGLRVTATTPAIPETVFEGELTLINHHVDPKTRAAKARIELDTPEDPQSGSALSARDRGLLPDLWMTVQIEKPLGEKQVIPRAALFDTGRRQYVFVQSAPGTYTPREVRAGARLREEVVIEYGLEPGERVVTDGLFLLDSESLLRAAASGNSDDHESPLSSGLPSSASPPIAEFWKTYHALSDALETDNLDTTQSLFREIAENVHALRQPSLQPQVNPTQYLTTLNRIHENATGPVFTDLQTARTVFGHLSEAIIAWSQGAPETLPSELRVASCPMWTDSPNRWIQETDPIENPFMGSAMLQCGSIDRVLLPAIKP